MHATRLLLAVAVLVLAALTGTTAAPDRDVPVATPLASPAPPGSTQPQLAVAPDGTTYLTWLEPRAPEGHRFRFATLAAGAPAWKAPVTIHEGSGFFANWADVPSLAIAENGMIAAHWLQVSGRAKYAYHVKVRTSRDGGGTWSLPFSPHRDDTPTEHGFASFFPWPDDPSAIGLAWLDGRDFAAQKGAEHEMKGQMALRAARISDASAGEDMLLDARVCDCCPTTAVRTARGVAVAYRDRSAEEIRDIYVTRFENGRWTEGQPAARDNWQIAGCPVNGPSMSAAGDRVVLAWFAAPESEARVRVAFSTDGARTFGAPVRVDDGGAMGRVDVEWLPDGTALVGWIEQLGPGKGAEFRARRVSAGGTRGDSIRIASLAASRASGYPRMALSGDRIVFAWTGQNGVETSVGSAKGF